MLETDSVQFGTTAIDYSIQRSDLRKKTIAIEVNFKGVKVIAPVNSDNKSLQQLVCQKASWICDRAAVVKINCEPNRHRK